ncbi:hypothetical protein pVco5_115 [Vibrio phage pVco-5]|uniref:Uncharacterized protein n=1 Tax=Vibrio phage pVco-5 TaxID=1965485 RepID=A0A1W6JUZ6_9CAUD|nr:virion structural protein [Vibrio phage pVco-5]ARM71104.1 hypothetical protein pVco5_115 [Vibrio phage pVco-5]
MATTTKTTVDINDITTGVIDGDGSFDKLMAVAKLHLIDELKNQRISGDKYAEVYMATMQAVLTTATQFSLSAIQTNKQLELTSEQIKQLQAEILNIPKQGQLLDKQVELADAQEAQVKAETLNVPKQGILLDAQAKLTGSQDAQVQAETVNVGKQGNLIDKQVDQATSAIAVNDANIELTTQRKKTEQAQILDSVDGAVVAGTVGKQKDVYSAQIKGFKDDAITKATKMMIDVFSVQRSTDDGFAPPSKLTNPEIDKMVATMTTQVQQNP